MRISDWSSDVCSSDLGWVYQNGDINSSSFALGVRRLGFAPAAARHRGPTRCAPQARKRSWPKVTTHMAGARSQADLASQGAGVRRRVVCLVGERSEEHTSELQSLMRISYAVFCLK